MAGRVLSDASPLIGLGYVDGLSWLQQLFGAVWIPQEVNAELITGQGFAGEAALLQAQSDSWLRLAGPTPSTPALPDLDEGEAACIRTALADAQPALLLMDERAGRAVATAKGLKVAGTAAVIGIAKQRGLIALAKPVFERLHGSDFRISAEVIGVVLRRVGE
jgi:predicted nucleic acid-binding protein